MHEETCIGRKKKTYSNEFKKKCILELLDGKPIEGNIVNVTSSSKNLKVEAYI